jgi:hypothetical protein
MSTVAGADEAEQAPVGTEPAPEQAQADTEQPPEKPGFGQRGQMRRRARFLRKARELAYRDLGGLVFDLHRFGQRNDPLVLAKLAMLREIDRELRGLEQALQDRRPVTVLREVGIATCPRCAALHGSDDRFCPACGLAFDTHADRPISTAPISPLAASAQPATAMQTPMSAPAPTTTPAFSPVAPTPTTKTAPPAPRPTSAATPAPASAPTQAVKTAPVPARAHDEEDEQTQILRPPARNE